MAKPKRRILVSTFEAKEGMEGTLSVWANDVSKREREIYQIEGITFTRIEYDFLLVALADPRYDIKEIAKEIEVLLAEKPEL